MYIVGFMAVFTCRDLQTTCRATCWVTCYVTSRPPAAHLQGHQQTTCTRPADTCFHLHHLQEDAGAVWVGI